MASSDVMDLPCRTAIVGSPALDSVLLDTFFGEDEPVSPVRTGVMDGFTADSPDWSDLSRGRRGGVVRAEGSLVKSGNRHKRRQAAPLWRQPRSRGARAAGRGANGAGVAPAQRGARLEGFISTINMSSHR